jgi:type IV secretion system protein VirD4
MLGLLFPAHGEALDDGGHQQQPELAEAAFTPKPLQVAEDMSLLDDDLPFQLPVPLDPRQQRNARLAALDPDDGIAL